MSKLILDYYKDQDTSVYRLFRNLDKRFLNLLKNIDIEEENKKIPIIIKQLINPKKANLLGWYDFKPEDDVLIVNDALGYITEGFCDKVNSVTVVEFSKSIADITDMRLATKENVDIYVGDTLDITFLKNFDYVVLIDTFEPKNQDLKFKDPYKEFFDYVGYFLKPKGKLILSVNNLFGFRNWAGAYNEINGELFADLGYEKALPETLYTKYDYDRIFQALGYIDPEYYYPIPDQYSPELVLSSKDLKETSVNKYFQNYALYHKKLFNESNVVDDVIKNDKFYLFANSYLIVVNKKEIGELTW